MNTKNSLKTIAYWTLPQGIQTTIRDIYRQTRKSYHQQDSKTYAVASMAKKNSIFKNKHQGERCFILATGPSVNKQDLSILKGELCFAVSHFFLHKDIKIIAPKYHILAPYHYPFDFQTLEKVFSGFNSHYSKDVTYFFGYRPYDYSIYDFLQTKPQYKRENSYYINYSNSQALDRNNYLNSEVWNICYSPFEIRTVIYSAIQTAIYMGCKEIYLIGCDHDYLNDTTRVTNHHFYKEEDGVSDAEHLKSFSTEKWFEEYYFRWKQYRLMKEFANLNNIKIFNATQGGMLDVFPRVKLSTLFKNIDFNNIAS